MERILLKNNFFKKNKCSGDGLNLSEREQVSKSRKMLNFAPADRNGTEGNTNSSSSIDDVASSETAREKLKRKLLQKNGVGISESWLWRILATSLVGKISDLTLEHSPFESSNEIGSVLTLYPSEKHTYDKQTVPFQPVRLIVNVAALGVNSVSVWTCNYQVRQTSRIGEWRCCGTCKEPSLFS